MRSLYFFSLVLLIVGFSSGLPVTNGVPAFAAEKAPKFTTAHNVVYMKCSKDDKSFLLSHFLVIEGRPPAAHAASWPSLSTTPMIRQGDITYYLEKSDVTNSNQGRHVNIKPISDTCNLGDKKIEFVLDYGNYPERSPCVKTPAPQLTLKEQGKNIFVDIPFDADCQLNISVQTVKYTASGGWRLCGGGELFGSPEFCATPTQIKTVGILSALDNERLRVEQALKNRSTTIR
jgi:hypothetical protein